MTPSRRRWRRLRRALVYGLAGMIILAGVAVAVLGQMLPLLARDPEAVGQWLSERAGRPIRVEAVQARWNRQGPLFDLEGLSIGEGEERLDIGRAALQLDVYAGLLPGRPFSSLRLDGLSLTLEHAADGQWQLHGIARSGSGDGLSQLEGLGQLVIDAARLRVVDEHGRDVWQLPRFDARMQGMGERLRFSAAAYPKQGAPLQVRGDFDHGVRNGRVYLSLRRAELATWMEGLAPEGIEVLSGQVDVELWARRASGRWVDVEAQMEATTLGVRRRTVDVSDVDAEVNAQGDTDDVIQQIDLPALRGRWQSRDAGWQAGLDAAQGVHLRAASSGAQWTLSARDLALTPWLPVLPERWLGGEKAADLLREGAARAQLRGLAATFEGQTLHSLEAQVSGIGIDSVDELPGFRDLDLDLHWRDEQLDVRWASPDFVLDWPDAMLTPVPVALHGAALIRQDEGDWAVGLSQLIARGSDFAFDAAGEMRFDGGRPSLDLRVEVFEGPVIAAKHFWMRHIMPPPAVRWLDEALLDGTLVGGRLLLRGDLDDWPFDDQSGRFLAEAELANIALAYQPDWPVATGLTGRATFLNNGFDAEVSAEVLGNSVRRATGRIAAYSEPRLQVEVAGGGSGEGLLTLLRQSPLAEQHVEHLDALSIGGRADVGLTLDIPLKSSLGAFSMQGHARLHEADLRESRWEIALDAADGELQFSHRGLSARALAVRFAGQPAQFDIALGAAVEGDGPVRAALRGRLEAGSLIASRPGLEWLQPHLSGIADWHVDVDVPGEGAPRLRIESDMVGVRIGLPPPLAKAPAVRMPLRAEIELGEARGGLDLQLGGLLRLDGRIGEQGQFDGVAVFGEAAAVEPPSRGLRVMGQVPALDATAWLTMADADGDSEFRLEDVDLHAGELSVLGRAFDETRLRFERTEDLGMQVRFDGQSLQGRVELPPAEHWIARGITAHFERLHWREAKATTSALPDLPPGLVPPIHLWVGDLRLGDAALGETRLETFPQPNGMRVDLFESRSSAMQLFGRGLWTRDGERQHTHIELEFTAQDLGKMLAALGFSDLIEGGQTLARLRADWSGSPMTFSMGGFDGDLEISVGQGRIPQVEPGAGRFLGLFSLTEIPRRLSLDFSDFFRSGLVFNTISGHFRFAGGDARTDNLLIDSPAAQINLRGRTGLRARDYDQTMEVLPRTSSMLPVVGAIAGGPAGAAIGAVAQAMLKQPLKQVNRTLYRVEGTWESPKVEVIERGPGRADPAPGSAGDP